MTTVLPVGAAALLLDRLLGEPCRWHPLVGFGALAARLERHGYQDSRARGAVLWLLLVVPPVAAAGWMGTLAWSWTVELLLLYLALGGRSLAEHAGAVRAALERDDLPAARRAAGAMVSRDLHDADAAAVSAAAVESVLENGNDAVFAVLFWYALAGPAGIVVYRLANTLDAMWGYRSARYERFGQLAARIDDALNWLPARFTVLAYALAGRKRAALRCVWRQGRRWKSPNAGPVMAAGAGALGVQLGGPARYHGQVQQRPALGDGRPPAAVDIDRACRLVDMALLWWLGGLALAILGWQWLGA